jgi:hypothetical protein
MDDETPAQLDESRIEPPMTRGERHREERRSVEEAGGGESEGFELAQQELIEHLPRRRAQTGSHHARR